MNRLFIAVILVTVAVSCQNYKKDVSKLTQERDSITREAELKDSAVTGYLEDFNEIMATLDSIKTMEKLVTVKSSGQREMSYSQKQAILDDVALLNEMLQKNKEQLAALQKKLNNANYKVGKLNSTIAELERLVSSLQKQVDEKDAEIARLNTDVQNLSRDVIQLNEKIAVMESESQEKSNTIDRQVHELNKAFYVIGSRKELEESGVVDRSGGFLGIGRTSVVKEDFNKEVFTAVDIRDFAYIPLNTKKAEVITVHPAGSFHISGEKTADTLFVDNQNIFWNASKFLVVVTK
ncbi:hypothetical protein INQ51_08980 [Maribellus sp. CM-23]|uniref:Cbp1 family collagen-binding glycoprotein adhesin n=1 Tax=Maribellus sp. CM-23 TaxID=2781026 RepID=UPI001F48E9B6|nr:hypothetical protein [Maribellus sp. CM-23]MCE4564442.1 hypothetical protein [Maribellus sp. CM-23]